MATQTQTIRRPPVQQERLHDYLYDNHYVVSSERDHARATFKAHTGLDRVKRVPIAHQMFSELRHYPRFQMKLQTVDPVPKFISRQWRGYAEQARESLVRHTTFNYDPAVKVPHKDYPAVDVAGRERYKYYRRPIIPFLQTVPPDVVLADARHDPLAGASAGTGVDGQGTERPMTPLVKTVMTQTDYRESEAQTDPYTPEYVVRPGSQPELLTLATLAYGRGLPAGLAEVEMIERARQKRAWEATLPPLNDMSQLEKRKKMMDDMETKEWALREQEIEKLQEERLEILKQLLRKREDHHQELNTKRLDRLWARKQEEKEAKVKRVRNEHIKIIRKLTEKRRKVEGKLERRDITHDYSSFGSQTYAPMTRIGVFLDRNSELYNVKSKYLNSYEGLLELEQSLPAFVTQPRVKAPKPKTSTKAGFIKRKFRKEKELAEVHEVIKHEKSKIDEPPKPLRFLTKIEKPQPRPPTPSVDIPSTDEEEKELAVIFLQKLIRGRAIQNMMFEGKEKRIELIQELRSTHALQAAEQAIKKQEKQATIALQRQRKLHEHKENVVDEALSKLEGTSIGDSLDFLSKELIRLQEERRIHAFSMLAERQRRIREAEESGRRQVEERRRREQDEIFKQTVKVHQDTVDTYLEDIILSSIDKTADIEARREINDIASMINDVAYEMEDKRDELQSEEIVAELVHCFLLPEVQKQTVREKVKRQQRKDLLAAHKEIHGHSEEVVESQPKRTPKTEARPAEQMAKVFTPTSPRSRSPQAAIGDSSLQQTQQETDEAVQKPASPSQEEQQETTEKPASLSQEDQHESAEKPASPSQEEQQETIEKRASPSQEDQQETTEKPVSSSQEEQQEIAEKPASPSQEEQQETTEKPASPSKEEQQETNEKPASPSQEEQQESAEKPASPTVAPKDDEQQS